MKTDGMSESLTKGIQRISGTRNTLRKPVNILTFDVETSGLGTYSQVRSLAASQLQVTGGSVTSAKINPIFSAHFKVGEMESLSMSVKGGSPKKLGTGVFDIERAAERGAVGDLFDLATESGRKSAVQQYKKFFQNAIDADFVART